MPRLKYRTQKKHWTKAMIRAMSPRERDQHQAYMRMDAQAHYRGEQWLLTRDEFIELWQDQWDQRGRSSEDLMMTRRDPEGAWSRDNVEIVTRGEFYRKQALMRKREYD